MNRARQLLELEAERSPGLVDLARPLALAVRIEIELARAMRLRLLPGSDAWLEHDLWFSPLIKSADPTAISLLPEVREELLQDLAAQPGELEAAWTLVRQAHAALDQVVLLEEEITYLSLRGDQESLERAQSNIGKVVLSLRQDPKDGQLLSWIGRFLPRLPHRMRGTESAIVLQNEASRERPRLRAAGIPTLSEGLQSPSLEAVEVGVRRVEEGVWLSSPPEPDSLTFAAPRTEPLRLDVGWPVASGWASQAVDLRPGGEPQLIPLPLGQVRLLAVDESEFRLRPDDYEPLLFVMVDEAMRELPTMAYEEMEDLDWDREERSLGNPSNRAPLESARIGNRGAAATLVAFANLDSAAKFASGELAERGLERYPEIAHALRSDQPLLIMIDGFSTRVSPSEEPEADAFAAALRGCIDAQAVRASLPVDADPGRAARSSFRGALLEIDQGEQRRWLSTFLESRFELRDKEARHLEGLLATVDGEPGFFCGSDLVVTEGSAAEDAVVIWREVPSRAARIGSHDRLSLYRAEGAPDGHLVALPSTEPIEAGARCICALSAGGTTSLLAGFVDSPSPDKESPHKLAVRLPSEMAADAGLDVFGPVIESGSLIGIAASLHLGSNGAPDHIEVTPTAALAALWEETTSAQTESEIEPAERPSVGVLVRSVEKRITPGLFRCADPSELRLEPVRPSEIPTDRPVLLLLHGFAANTEGSFHSLWNPHTPWRRAFDDYGPHVYTLEHLSISRSAFEHAADLAEKLPRDARLHILSHSTGGIIGELLSRAQRVDAETPFDEAEFSLLDHDPGDLRALHRLDNLLREKRFQIERFVRVGCPARGSALDFMRAWRTAAKFVAPFGLPVLIDLVVGGIVNEDLPGFASFRKDSAVIRMINRPEVQLAGDLCIVAAATEGEGVWGRLQGLAIDMIFRGENDLFVDTESMFAGARRVREPERLLLRGQTNHFNYFDSGEVASQAVRWLLAPSPSEAA